jgi:hypothetical protein
MVFQIFENCNVYEHQQKEIAKLFNGCVEQTNSEGVIGVVQNYRQAVQQSFNQKVRNNSNDIGNVEFSEVHFKPVSKNGVPQIYG